MLSTLEFENNQAQVEHFRKSVPVLANEGGRRPVVCVMEMHFTVVIKNMRNLQPFLITVWLNLITKSTSVICKYPPGIFVFFKSSFCIMWNTRSSVSTGNILLWPPRRLNKITKEGCAWKRAVFDPWTSSSLFWQRCDFSLPGDERWHRRRNTAGNVHVRWEWRVNADL